MSRAPVTIAILAWNSWETTKACLDSLRPTLGARDQVVVVDNGSTDATPAGLRRYPWAEVVTNGENRGFAGGCNDAAARAGHDFIVFLNNDTILAHQWIDPLVASFDDPTVGAAGPRSNFVSGPQVVEEASYSSSSELRRFAREWASKHKGKSDPTDRLVGFCLAVRRSLFEEVGRFDEGYGIGGFEDDDLCQKIVKAGYRLVVRHDSFVHHEGHKTFDANGLDWFAEQQSNRDRFFAAHHLDRGAGPAVFISACLIVKDEEDHLGESLDSLVGLVDQVVVYDTGSTDRTVAVARDRGASVIEGYWDDDFSRARNDALSHCQGEWVVWLDADETLQTADPLVLRSLLSRTKADIDAWSVRIENLTGVGVGSQFSHHAARIFRRSRCEWTGRLHEQIARRGDHSPIVQANLEDGGWIRHTGYLEESLRSRNKAERNLRVAQAEVDRADGWDRGYSLTSLGRSLLLAGRAEEALDRVTEALDHTENGITRRLAIRAAVDATLELGRFDDAVKWCSRLRAEGADANTADAMEATVRVARQDWGEVLKLLSRVVPGQSDADGFAPPAGLLAAQRAQALMAQADYGAAADVLLESLADEGVLDTHLGSVVECMQKSGRSLKGLVAAIPQTRITLFLAQVLQLQPEVADDILEAGLSIRPDSTGLLAAASTLAVRLPLDRAIIWSSRLRQIGQGQACPLIAIAGTGSDLMVKARAAAVAMQTFGDLRAGPLFLAAYDAASPTEKASIFGEATQLCPDLAEKIAHQLPPGGNCSARPGGDVPRVTVVIPCFNHAELTLGCLDSLHRCTDLSLFQTILVDNGSTDSTTRMSGMADDRFRVLRNEENLGFGPACNQGAAMASTDYICFLNNDTVLRPGWLEPLVAALDEDPRLGAVQPKLLYPDGRLNDAGGLVFRDGKPWVYGKGHPDPCAPEFATRRAPDYASGACLLVRRNAFVEVGGFDDRYAPAYYEDTDLSFEMRAHGWKVLYEPASTIIHLEGGTAGTDASVGLKQYQVRNASRFSAKWATELSGRAELDPTDIDNWAHRPQDGFGPGERLGSVEAGISSTDRKAKRILVMDLTMPVFDRASGSLRLFNLLRTLREDGHCVTFYAATGGDRRYADAVGRFGVTCFGADPARVGDDLYRGLYQPNLDDLFTRRRFDLVLVSTWHLGESAIPVIRHHAPEATVVLDTNDVHFLRLERGAQLSGKAADIAAAAETRRRELAVYRQVDRIVAVSQEDADVLRAELPHAHIIVVPNAHDLVDPGPDFSERRGALFVGNFNHLPNRDALEWWAGEIRALLGSDPSAIDLTVVGNDPDGFAAGWVQPGISVTGTVPSTLPYLHRARVSVAPLRYGAGMKGKVGEALAAGVPVVGTSVAAEGMGLVHGRHILIADTADEFVRAVHRLNTDELLWEQLRDAGRRHIADHFGLERMRNAVKELVDPASPPTSNVYRHPDQSLVRS